MTSSMSAAAPMASVIAVEGVSGEMATPARMPFALIVLISPSASSVSPARQTRCAHRGLDDARVASM